MKVKIRYKKDTLSVINVFEELVWYLWVISNLHRWPQKLLELIKVHLYHIHLKAMPSLGGYMREYCRILSYPGDL